MPTRGGTFPPRVWSSSFQGGQNKIWEKRKRDLQVPQPGYTASFLILEMEIRFYFDEFMLILNWENIPHLEKQMEIE